MLQCVDDVPQLRVLALGVLQCVAVCVGWCCIVLMPCLISSACSKGVAVCCSVLQCVAVC